MSADYVPVMLGVPELKADCEIEARDFRCLDFVTKFGGRPVWLDLENIPEGKRMECKYCQSNMPLLMQMYCPVDTMEGSAFHRMLYIFICPSIHANEKDIGVVVLRTQLPRKNKYYPEDLCEDESADSINNALNSKLDLLIRGKCCVYCGCKGSKRCSICDSVYCSKYCQTNHWKNGHKDKCSIATPTLQNHYFPQFTLLEVEEALPPSIQRKLTELSNTILSNHPSNPYINNELYTAELESDDDDDDNVINSMEEQIDVFNENVKSIELNNVNDGDMGNSEQDALEINDHTFSSFQKRIKTHPTQVLRYYKGCTDTQGLVVSDDITVGSITSSVLNCPLCNTPRTLELQITPQVLYYTKLDIDFGLLSVYTCPKACPITKYTDEQVLVQHHSAKNLYRPTSV